MINPIAIIGIFVIILAIEEAIRGLFFDKPDYGG